MQESADAQLLRNYADNGSEAAFREIVERHIDVVYSAALRQVASPDLAQDISQSVFVDLARKAKSVSERLAPDASLVGWLYRSTRFAVLTHLRDDRRRSTHERQAMEQLITDSTPAQDWDRIRPLLDEAMAELSDDDREAVLLRYFKNHDFRAVGRALGTSDDTAQKRVSRAVERLREFFSKRGIAMGAAGLVVVISANAVQAAPIGLAAAISAAAVLAGAAIQTSTAIAATKAIAMTTLQKALVTATVVALAGTGIYEAHQTSQLHTQIRALQQQQAPLTQQIAQLQQERDDATNRVAALTEELAAAKGNNGELLRLRGEVGVLTEELHTSENSRSSQSANVAGTLDSTNHESPGQLAMEIARGDSAALLQLRQLAHSQLIWYRTNSIGLTGEDKQAVLDQALAGIPEAFDWLEQQAIGGNKNARQAIDQAAHMSGLEGFAVEELGKLAGQGDENALQTLLKPDQNGLLLSSTVTALGPAANNGNEQAITALAAVLEDQTKKPLWFLARSALEGAAAANPIAAQALKSMPAQQ